jgi:uncharacterized protein (TIGR02996 family)
MAQAAPYDSLPACPRRAGAATLPSGPEEFRAIADIPPTTHPAPRPEVLAFLDEIKDRPDDDTPRLVLADWLQEHGSPEEAARGELIRVQVLRAGLLPNDPRQPALHRRQVELQRRHVDAWVGPLMDHVVWRFERGLLHLEARGDKLLAREAARLATLAVCLWLESLEVREVRTQQAARMASSPFLPPVTTLSLADNDLRHEGIAALVASPSVRRLRRLLLAGNRLGPAGAIALAGSPHLAGLTLLDLAGNRVGDEGAFALADSPYLTGLTHLRLGSNRIGEEGRAALRARFGGRVSLA